MIKRITASFKNPLSLGIIPALAMALAFGLNYTYAAWSEPTSAPTGGNVAAPINVGNSNQTKTGGGVKVVGNTYGLWGSGSSYGVYGKDSGDGGAGYLGYGPYGVFSMEPIYAGGGLQLPTGAGAGKVLTSDASGNATWQTVGQTTAPTYGPGILGGACSVASLAGSGTPTWPALGCSSGLTGQPTYINACASGWSLLRNPLLGAGFVCIKN